MPPRCIDQTDLDLQNITSRIIGTDSTFLSHLKTYLYNKHFNITL